MLVRRPEEPERGPGLPFPLQMNILFPEEKANDFQGGRPQIPDGLAPSPAELGGPKSFT